MNEIYQLFITGILIFAFQRIFVELWIKPLNVFYSTLNRLESFLIKYAYLSQRVWSQNKILDQELREGRDKIREYAGDLIANYSRLFILEKIWIKRFKKLDIQKAKKSLIKLSNYLGNIDETKTINLRIMASEQIDEVRKCLKFDLSD